MRTTRADDFKQRSHLLGSTSFSDERFKKKISSNCSHEVLYLGCLPVPVTTLATGHSLTQKELWPVGREGQRELWPPRQIILLLGSAGLALGGTSERPHPGGGCRGEH